VLVGAVDRRVHRNRIVHFALGVRDREQTGQDPVPSTVTAVAAVPLPNRLPWTELGRHVTPSDPAPVPVNDALHYTPVVPERTTPAAIRSGSSG
jgi:hypothetical protein